MIRALGLFAILLSACANGHANGVSGDSAVADSSGSGSGTDAASGTIDSPAGTIDAIVDATVDAIVDATVDAKPGAPDAKPPDAMVDANTCSVQPCTLAPQCGCPLNQSCDIDPTDLMGNVCRAVNTPGVETNTCASFGDCARGYVCIGDGTNDSCKRYCTSNSECGTPRGQCVIQIVDTTQAAIPGAVVCSSNCDPLGNAATYCPSGWKCGIFNAQYPINTGPTYDISDCEITGAGGQGADCTIAGSNPPNGDDTKCAANQMCTTLTGTTFQCRHVCNHASPGVVCSNLGKTCIGFNPVLTIGGTEYGVCN